MTKQKPTGYDIIGDVHGHADALVKLLEVLGYSKTGSSFRHPDRIAVFVGDLIDRGPKVRETLALVKAMADEGAGLVTVGNHEYNAVAYCTRGEDGEWLRPHSEKNAHQFEATRKAFEDDEDAWNVYLDWFRTLPLFLDLDEFRVVHACWSQRHIDLVGDRRLGDQEFLLESARPGSPEFEAVETLLKGPEIALPPDSSFEDKEGNVRSETRVKWWRSLDSLSYREASFPEQPSLSDDLVDTSAIDVPWDIYPNTAPPVFVGHYWLPPQEPHSFGNVVCLDYSVAKGGFLCAFRWDREGALTSKDFVSVFV